MTMEPLKRSEFLKLLALGGAGIAILGGPERALATLARAELDLDAAALDGDGVAAARPPARSSRSPKARPPGRTPRRRSPPSEGCASS